MSSKQVSFKQLTSPQEELPKKVVLGAGTLSWIVLLSSWFLLSASNLVPTMFLPSPMDVLSTGVRLAEDGTLFEHMWASVQVVLIGFIVSSMLSIPLGMLMGSFKIVQAILEPLVNFIRYLPVTSFVPLFILWIGIGIEQRVTVIFFGVFFQQLVMISDVSRGVSKDLLHAAYTLGTSRSKVVTQVIAPASLPGILDTLRVTIGWAWTYLVVAELVAATSGLGYISLKAMRGFQVDVIFLAIVIIGLLGLLTDQFFRVLRARLSAWAN
ncbi:MULTISPECIES: ABC transporter permease [Marinomonas]|uniref:NitT/TauT family transport system permease protein n=2 Tax=Marinomonas TaxID=28253 RepID=A0A366D256_9GAMM|nr:MULTISPECIES: ABC transporter permease [Marinomonas]AEF55549.1 ABC-type transporter, integral membrane subunit [Marinomonas posidonica IVIA-Po-181]RBO84167.1 NitT/TauT family transport system permease protein [Marinomonas aquiplantarum]